jgi:hypothetical protein
MSSSSDLWVPRPSFNPPKEIPVRTFNNLALFEAPDYTIQLVDNTIVASLITQKTLVTMLRYTTDSGLGTEVWI